jgi:hypothetical protein
LKYQLILKNSKHAPLKTNSNNKSHQRNETIWNETDVVEDDDGLKKRDETITQPHKIVPPPSKFLSIIPLPKCPLCHINFSTKPFEDRSPVMSLSCDHTICYDCCKLSVANNRIQQNKNKK